LISHFLFWFATATKIWQQKKIQQRTCNSRALLMVLQEMETGVWKTSGLFCFDEPSNMKITLQGLLVLLRPDPGVRVGHPDGQLLGALDQALAVLGGHSVGDLGAKLLVLHHQNFEFLEKDTSAHNDTFVLFYRT
jgi:hypothetical protein